MIVQIIHVFIEIALNVIYVFDVCSTSVSCEYLYMHASVVSDICVIKTRSLSTCCLLIRVHESLGDRTI